jgi:hypothetical protein
MSRKSCPWCPDCPRPRRAPGRRGKRQWSWGSKWCRDKGLRGEKYVQAIQRRGEAVLLKRGERK